jgi:RHS repeat-associated protein
MNLSNKDIYLQYALSQFLPFGEVRRGSSFNAFNCMKAYSYNGERYGYYGYDASGERTYKYDIFSAGSWTNEAGGMNVSLQIDKMMLYPNGYLNMNQNGEYTKHYYADALRIASKIGSGFSQNLCDEMDKILNGVDPSYLDERRDRQYEEMMEELTELINGNQIMDINPIPYPEADLCNLFGDEREDALFFYHPDHLGSTGMVTDNNANITQGFLYTPFGELLYEYDPGWESGRIPKYSFNAKELDEENGMYYYSARYYAPPTFISRDPLFEKYPSISPYTYCGNNPMKYVDPDGNAIRAVGTEANNAFKNYLLSFKGVTKDNMRNAFSLAKSSDNFYFSNATTYKQFSSNFKNITGGKLNRKEGKVLFNALSNQSTLEISILTAKESEGSYVMDAGTTKSGTRIVSYIPNYEESRNGNPLWQAFVDNIEGTDLKNFNAAFDKYSEGKDWIHFGYEKLKNQIIEERNLGTILINGNRNGNNKEKINEIITNVLEQNF